MASLLHTFVEKKLDKIIEVDENKIHCMSASCKKIPKVTYKPDTNTVISKCTCKPKEESFPLNEYISIMAQFNAKRKPCTFNSIHTTTPQKGEVYCIECQTWMCSPCHKDHLSKPEYSLHQYVTDQTEQKCSEHDKQFISFCLPCEENLCAECIKHHTKSHKLVSVTGIKDDSLVIESKSLLEKASVFLDECESIKDKLVSALIEDNQHLSINLTDEYASFRKRNENIIAYSKLFLSSYIYAPFNYNNKRNLLCNTNFHLIKPSLPNLKQTTQKDEFLSNLFKFFHNTSILHEGSHHDNSHQKALDYNITINEHDDKIKHLLILSDGRLLTGSYDHFIKCYTLTNDFFKFDFSIEEQADVHYFTELPDNVLVTCGEMQETVSIKLRKLSKVSKKSYKDIGGCDGGDFVIKVISISKGRFGSINMLGDIYIWETASLNLLSKIQMNVPGGSFIQVSAKDVLIACSTQTHKVMRMWDLKTYTQKERDLEDVGCLEANSMVEVEKDLIAVGDFGMIHIVDVNKWRKVKEISNEFLNGRLITALCYGGEYLLHVGCDSGYYAIINMNCDDENDIVYCDKWYMHTETINVIAIKDGKHVITGGNDKIVRIWDIVSKKREIPFTPVPNQV